MAAGGLLLVQAAARAHLDPLPTVALTVAAVMLSLYKLKLPLASGTSTMSMAATVDFVALLTAGVELATLVAAIAVLLQCTVRVPRTQPLYRSAFSVASVVLSVQAAGLVWRALQGDVTTPTFDRLLVPLSAAATAYFVVNTALVAGAIALSFSTSPVLAWNRDFLWSAPGYFLAAAVGATVALIMVTAAWELLPLAVSPLYISYRAYQISVRRLEEERWHAQELAKLVNATRQALARATQSEAALAAEKERLALESARLRVTVQAINDAVITVDRMGAVLLMNDRARSLASMKPGAAPAGEMGAIFEVLALPPGMYESTLERLLVGGYPVRLRNEPLDQGANIPLVEITGTPTRDQDGRVAGAVWVVRDITDAERIAQERAKAARLESLGVLAGGLAHDFNNILMGIVGNLSLAQGLVRPEESALALRLAQAAAACARARGVTNQLLTFAKGGTPVKKSASLRELVLECTRFALSGSTVAPRFDVAPDLWACDIDHVQIGQVVHNLVLNAVQATPRDGIVEVAMKNVVLSATTPPAGVDLAPGKYVQLTVRDHGDGILPQHLGRIFDPYFTTKKRGSGLGLAISYSIVKAHGGAITAASEPGSGSTFSVFLPASAQ
ncbi:MAG TPA: ATP-binding protein, partial [Dehalococcoidia bacterium]|nr:ATP-binding protein [Dehalococcoidia bacterium]